MDGLTDASQKPQRRVPGAVRREHDQIPTGGKAGLTRPLWRQGRGHPLPFSSRRYRVAYGPIYTQGDLKDGRGDTSTRRAGWPAGEAGDLTPRGRIQSGGRPEAGRTMTRGAGHMGPRTRTDAEARRKREPLKNCPLVAGAVCQRDKCAWWVERDGETGECAMTAIARTMRARAL